MAAVVDFEYLAPTSVEEAVSHLGARDGDVKVLAGGQSLIPLLNYRLARPCTIVDINALPLASIAVTGDRLRLGALTRHAALEESAEIRSKCPVLAEAASLIGNVRVRTLGTLGGSLAHADPAAELPMAMLALDARLTLHGRGGLRVLEARRFFTGILTTALRSDELLVQVDIPVTPGMGYAVEEFARRAGDFALVATMTLVTMDRHGRLDDVRIALAGVGSVPVRAEAAEDELRGKEPTAERLSHAAATVGHRLQAPTDAFASGAYRNHLAAVLTRRALTRAVVRVRGAG